MSEILESEKRLQQECEELKADRERRINDYHRQLEREKDTYRQRLGEAEGKTKEAERAKSQMMFEAEKERARW